MLCRMSHAFRPLAAILQTVIQRHGLGVKLVEHQLLQRWPEIAGPQIAAHSRPDQIRFRKLTLLVQNSVWLQQLLFLKPSLIEKINTRAGNVIVTDILLRVGEIGGTPSDRPPVVRTSQSGVAS
jgi:predicted nucleic acid-binding Zn ribbon protein